MWQEKIKVDRERPIAHTVWLPHKTVGAYGLSISQHFSGSDPFLGTFFKTLLGKGADSLARNGVVALME